MTRADLPRSGINHTLNMHKISVEFKTNSPRKKYFNCSSEGEGKLWGFRGDFTFRPLWRINSQTHRGTFPCFGKGCWIQPCLEQPNFFFYYYIKYVWSRYASRIFQKNLAFSSLWIRNKLPITNSKYFVIVAGLGDTMVS